VRQPLAPALVALLALAAAPGAAETHATHQFLIEVGDAGRAEVAAAVEAAGGALVHHFPEIGAASAISESPGFPRALRRARGIRRVDRDLRVDWLPHGEGLGSLEPLVVADAPPAEAGAPDPASARFLPCQWHMSQIRAEGAWALGHLGSGATVAVLDTGVSGDPAFGGGLPQVDMQGRLIGNVTLVSEDEPSVCAPAGAFDSTSPLDYRFHGTFVAGLVAARGLRVAGIAPDARILGVKVLNCLGGGTFSDVIAGILFAADRPEVDVINMSLSAYFPKSAPDAGPLIALLMRTIAYAEIARGKLVVSSAGNNAANLDRDRNLVVMPAQAGRGIAAWAGDIDGNLASYSNHGRSGTWVGAGGGDETPDSPSIPIPDCGLPRRALDGIVSVCSPDSIFFPDCSIGDALVFGATGTSFSAPLVAGVAALAIGAHGPMSASRLRLHLKRTADDLGKRGRDNLFSFGRVHAERAVWPLGGAPLQRARAAPTRR